MWKDQKLESSEISDFKNLSSVLNWAREYYKELNKFTNKMDKYDPDKIIIIPWAGRIAEILGRLPEDANLAETILQVAVHSSHHRGQVSKRLREIGGKPKIIDFIAWTWTGKPLPVWGNITSKNTG